MVVLNNLASIVSQVIQNPFGLGFEVHDKKLYVPVGSVINCIGYNDFLERFVGVARMGFALLALATTESKKERLLAAGHVFRGALEMRGDFEFYLLVLDAIFTVVNVSSKLFPKPNGDTTPAGAN